MAIAFDASSLSTAWQTTPNPQTWTHTPAGTPRGVIVFISGHQASLDEVTGVTYGGVSMTRVPTNGYATDAAVEVGSVYAYTLHSSIPTGAQTVSIAWDDTGTNAQKRAACITVTAAADTEIVTSGKIDGDAANPSLSLDSGAVTAFRAFVLFSGRPLASITLGSGLTSVLAEDLDTSTRSRHVAYETTPATGSTARGWTASSDDVAMIGVALKEASVTTGTGALTLVPASVAGTGSVVITATGAIALQPAAVSGTGLAGAVGTGAATLAPVAVSGTGTQTFSATGALTLQPVSVSGTGAQTFSASGTVTLQPVAMSGTGIAGMVGTGAVTLQPVSVAGSGTHTEDTGATGSGDLTLQPVAVSGTGTQTFSASGSITLQPAAVSGTGLVGSIATGSITLQPVSVSGTGTQTIGGTGAIVLPSVLVTGSGSASQAVSGTGAIALAAITVSGAGVCTNPAIGSVVVTEVRPWTATVMDEGRGTLSVAISGVWSINTVSSPVWSVELVDEQV